MSKKGGWLQWFRGTSAADPALDEKWYSVVVDGSHTHAGVFVSPETAKRVSTVYRCVSLLSNALATLPFGVFERLERGRREVLDHAAYRTFAVKSNPYQTPIVFKRMMMGHLVLRGNCYARITRGPMGLELWPLHPERVKGPELLPSGRLRYRYTRPDTGQDDTLLGGIDIWHLTGLSDDGLRGLAPADLAKDTIGLAMAAEQHGAKVFGKGVRLAGALKLPEGKEMSKPAKDALSKSFRDEHADLGLPVLEDGLDFVNMGMTSEQAQYLESRKFSVSDIARWFGIPPHMVGDVERSTSWGTGIENQTIQFVTDGLMPWVQLWEESIDDIFIPEPTYYSKFNINARLRADSKTRFDVYQIGITNGIYSPNDCRAFEDENPRLGGDQYVTPRSPNEPRPPGSGPGQPSPPDEEPKDDDREALAIAAAHVAKANASTLLSEECAAVTRLAKEHSRDGQGWRAAVASFYGRWSDRVSAATLCGQAEAGEYAERRRETVLAGGVKALNESKDEAVSLLVDLTLAAAAAGGKDAAA